MAEKGYERLKEFSWRKCAEETAKVYNQVLK
jgi:glycosyltransferase involved in cell wall biosynthesis